MAGNTENTKVKKPSRKPGRPAAPVKFNPEKAVSPKRRKTGAAIFKDHASADKWVRNRLARQVDDYDFLIDQLKYDLAANTDVMQALAGDGNPPTAEMLRARQSILTSMRTIMSGSQEMMIQLIKNRGLMDLGGDDEGGDVIINVQRLPDEESDEVTTHGGEITSN